jgi:predicted dehydrogenase
VERKLRMGMVGDAPIHRMATALDGKIELACGAFSSDPSRSLEVGRELFLPADRVYGTFGEMLASEAALPPGERMDFVTIAAPTDVHFPAAMGAVERGFPVVCERPLTTDLTDAKALAAVVKRSGVLFALAHRDSGYSMVKQARAMVREHELGPIRRVVVEFPDGWMSTLLETAPHKQEAWLTDPSRAGAGRGSALSGIGTDALHLAEYVTRLRVEQVSAETPLYPGRQLLDDASVLLRLNAGAHGILWASEACVGDETGLAIRVCGRNGSLAWCQRDPGSLRVIRAHRPAQDFRAGAAYLSESALKHTRVPAGPPEGAIEALANLYASFATALRTKLAVGSVVKPDFLTVDEGVRGLAFVEAVVKNSRGDVKWTRMS